VIDRDGHLVVALTDTRGFPGDGDEPLLLLGGDGGEPAESHECDCCC